MMPNLALNRRQMLFSNWVSSLVGKPAAKVQKSTAKSLDRKQLVREMSELAIRMNELEFITRIRRQPWGQLEEFVMLRSHFIAAIHILREGDEQEINVKLRETHEKISHRLTSTQVQVMALDNVPQLNVSLKCFLGLLCRVVKLS